MIVACYLSAIVYYIIEVVIAGNYDKFLFSQILSENCCLIPAVECCHVLIYIPPITIAAGTAMYLLDQVSSGATLTFTDYATAAVLTFSASAMLCFFVLLGYGVLYLPLIGQAPRQIYQLAPWTIPAALVATTFMLLSSYPRNVQRQIFGNCFGDCFVCALSLRHGDIGSQIAHFITRTAASTWQLVSTNPTFILLLWHLLVLAPCLGWLLWHSPPAGLRKVARPADGARHLSAPPTKSGPPAASGLNILTALFGVSRSIVPQSAALRSATRYPQPD